MGDAIADNVRGVLSEADTKPQCPKCDSKKMLVSYSSDFIVDLGKDTSEEAIDSGIDPYCITCFNCGETIYEM